MIILLIFFAIPLAVVILSAILESFINCPFKVAGIFFSIFIVLAFAFGGTAELIVAAIVYTLISFITAVIIRYIINRRCNCCENEDNNCRNCNNCDSCNSCNRNNLSGFNLNTYNDMNSLNTLNNLSRIASGVNNNLESQNVLADSSNFNNNINNTCRRYR